MIRLSKPVELLEWGEGTTTLNQIWMKVADGVIIRQGKPFWQLFLDWLLLKRQSPPVGMTTLVVEINGPFNRKNPKDDTIKVVQRGEGMTPCGNDWGEVAVGRFKSTEMTGGKTHVLVEIKGATKIGR